jgi:adenylate cyclase
VKGKARPVKVYEVLGFGDEEFSPGKEEALEHFESGLGAYRSQDWDLARKYFEAALEADPDDGPSRVYLDRTLEYAADPPPTDWDFVVRREVK